MNRALMLCTLVLTIGCGDDSSPGSDAGADAALDAPGVDAPGVDAPGIDAPIDASTERVVELIGGEWTMAGGSEGYVCVRLTVEETMFIREFRPVAPLGTHHTVLTYGNTATRPDGTTPCEAFTNAANMIYGSGVGTNPLRFPDGVVEHYRRLRTVQSRACSPENSRDECIWPWRSFCLRERWESPSAPSSSGPHVARPDTSPRNRSISVTSFTQVN